MAGFAAQRPAKEEKATYVGSEECKGCHDRIYSTWRMTLHAQVIQDVKKNPDAIKEDFKTVDKTRTFKKSDVVYTHGLQWKQRYINKNWRILPAQWNFETQKWAPYNVPTWKEDDWRSNCGYCHTTGFDRNELKWKELGVTCVTCHDPHRSKNKFQTRTSQNNLCLGCHSQISTDAEKGHAPVGGTLRQHSDCVGCHMPAVGKSAEVGDECAHHFRFIAPIATINLGGGDIKNQPNSCSVCHPGAPVDALNADFAERLPFRARRP